jgi:acid phosphatase class B
VNKTFPINFGEFYADIKEVIKRFPEQMTLDRKNINTFTEKGDAVFVRTGKSAPKFEEIPKAYFETLYFNLTDKKTITRNQMRQSLKIFRTSAISTLISKLPYIGHSTKPIRFWIIS